MKELSSMVFALWIKEALRFKMFRLYWFLSNCIIAVLDKM